MDHCLAGDGERVGAAQARVDAVSAVYQKGRTIGQSVCAMKAVLEILGIAERHMLPPLRACADAEVEEFRLQLGEMGLLH